MNSKINSSNRYLLLLPYIIFCSLFFPNLLMGKTISDNILGEEGLRPPNAVCISGLQVPINTTLYASDLDGGSTDPNGLTLTFSFSDTDPNDNTRTYACEDIGSQSITVYVSNTNNEMSSCLADIVIVNSGNSFTGQCQIHTLACDDEYSVAVLGMPNKITKQ